MNPEAHEFKYKTLSKNQPKYDEESSQKELENFKKNKGKYDLKNQKYYKMI